MPKCTEGSHRRIIISEHASATAHCAAQLDSTNHLGESK